MGIPGSPSVENPSNWVGYHYQMILPQNQGLWSANINSNPSLGVDNYNSPLCNGALSFQEEPIISWQISGWGFFQNYVDRLFLLVVLQLIAGVQVSQALSHE